MRIKFRPKRVADFQEMPDWIFRINDECKQQLEKKDKRKEESKMKTIIAVAVLVLISIPAFAGETQIISDGAGGAVISGDSGTSVAVPTGGGSYIID